MTIFILPQAFIEDKTNFGKQKRKGWVS